MWRRLTSAAAHSFGGDSLAAQLSPQKRSSICDTPGRPGFALPLGKRYRERYQPSVPKERRMKLAKWMLGLTLGFLVVSGPSAMAQGNSQGHGHGKGHDKHGDDDD